MIRLKSIREEHKISQQKLADNIGVSRSTIAMWETGGSQPDNESLIKLSKFFNVSIDYILGNSDEVSLLKTINKSEIEILFNKLNSLGKEKTESYIMDLLDNPKYTADDEYKPHIPSLEEAMEIQKQQAPLRTDRLGHDNIIHKAAFGGGVWEEKEDK